ncbi:hypothetical protein Pmar_PMAR001018 [Perkinsus marinus ATCC 50983]|uniref:RING-type domain-containing protein n=1 Tax=Perkinsus marinus (strain ATCC 50983 / TXsc) TaxID=423536 RepID=C5KTB6_PERM5|nr:hypothetical protein Pmar_PMAR001018 [Perkinsus marinus ATCC 50983]EER12221.1 hypothetical protein Pmar_PMAR001018 [Perkinsus marinus ATCC 50983]|eukprot:XP_002780426.1 hypothetical protein Pmar_PMAR001018 [Perkinsus marinus ATCC 50983]
MAITTCGGGCYHFVGRVLEEVRHPRRPVFSPTLALTNVVPVGPWSQRIANHDTRMISPNIDIDHASYCGYLYKQSKHLKRFRRRYCVLIIDKLYTFKQPEDVPRGLVTEILDLALADYLVEWEISPRVPNYNMIAGKFSFEIGTEAETPSRREWMFAAESEHDRREWIHKLGSYCRTEQRSYSLCRLPQSYRYQIINHHKKRRKEVWQLCCGHYFCVRCIQNWSKYKRTCPVCRDVF